MTTDKTFAFEATQDELLSLLKSAARTELQNPGAFEALLLRNFVPRPRDAEAAVVVVPVDLFRDIMIVVAGTGRDRELWDKLYDLRWSVPKPDGQP